MSKKKEEKQIEQPPLDHQSQMKMLSYTVTLREDEIADLKHRVATLTGQYVNLEKEHSELKAAYYQSFKTEKTVRQLQDLLDHSEKELEKLKEEKKAKEREYTDEKNEILHRHETEINKLKNIIDSYQKKIESVNSLQLIVEKQEDHIKQLELDKDKLRIEADEKVKNKEIRNQIKFSELKKKMMENIQETQKNVTQLNIEYMDVSTKLTLLQNHQLLIELEYQSQQIEELLKKKENLEKKVFELTKDIQVHKEVELALAAKNKKYSEMIKLYEKNDLSESISKEKDSIHRPIYINNNVKEFTVITSLENKILKLEAALKKKQEEVAKIKTDFEFIEEKLKNYEKRFSGLYYLFEEGLKKLGEDEELKNSRELYINLENIKKGNFNDLCSQERYSVLMLLMKYLVPLINPSEVRYSELGLSNSIDNVKIKYHMTKRFSDDPVLKKVFSSNRNTMAHDIRRSLENLPVISNMGINK